MSGQEADKFAEELVVLTGTSKEFIQRGSLGSIVGRPAGVLPLPEQMILQG